MGRHLSRKNSFLMTMPSETRPLLSASRGPTSYLQSSKAVPDINVDICVGSMNGTARGPAERNAWNARNAHNISTMPRLHELGWIEYHLPDGTFYYVHPTRRVTTDVNLRIEKVLNAVTAYLENDCGEIAPSGCELWLRDSNTALGSGRKSLEPQNSWVNHQTRSVVVDAGYKGGKKRKALEEDRE